MRKQKGIALMLAAAMCMTTACGQSTTNNQDSAESGKPASPQDNGQEQSDAVSSGEPVTITIWYEGNDSRLPFFKAAEAEMQKDYPNYSIEAITFDNATLTTKALQAVTTTGGVDLIFNEASRLLVTHQQSG